MDKYDKIPKPIFGVYNVLRKEFQFGIAEPSKKKAFNKLLHRIGKDAYKYRFEIRCINKGEIKKAKRGMKAHESSINRK